MKLEIEAMVVLTPTLKPLTLLLWWNTDEDDKEKPEYVMWNVIYNIGNIHQSKQCDHSQELWRTINIHKYPAPIYSFIQKEHH